MTVPVGYLCSLLPQSFSCCGNADPCTPNEVLLTFGYVFFAKLIHNTRNIYNFVLDICHLCVNKELICKIQSKMFARWSAFIACFFYRTHVYYINR